MKAGNGAKLIRTEIFNKNLFISISSTGYSKMYSCFKIQFINDKQ